MACDVSLYRTLGLLSTRSRMCRFVLLLPSSPGRERPRVARSGLTEQSARSRANIAW